MEGLETPNLVGIYFTTECNKSSRDVVAGVWRKTDVEASTQRILVMEDGEIRVMHVEVSEDKT